MEKFSLSTQSIATGRGGSRQLRTGSLSSNAVTQVAAPQIDSNAAKINFTPASIPQAVKDQTSQSIQNFMSTVSKAAFDYQERESQFFANEAVSKYAQAAQSVFIGNETDTGEFTPGYNSTAGGAALRGFDDYATQLNEAYAETIGALDPRTKQKAIFRMNTIKNEYVAKGANHRAKQLAKAEEQQVYLQRKEILTAMSQTPNLIHSRDAAGLTLKERAYNTFQLQEEADEWWSESIQNVTKTNYWDTYNRVLTESGSAPRAAVAAYHAAREYASKIAQPELAPFPAVEASVLSQLQTWHNQAIAAEADIAQMSLDRVELQQKQTEQSARNFMLDRYNSALLGEGGPMTRQEFSAWAQSLSESDHKYFEGVFFKPDSTETDPEAYGHYSNKAERGLLTTSDIEDMRRNPNINQPDTNRLETMNRQVGEATNKQALSSNLSYVNDVLFAEADLAPSTFIRNIDSQSQQKHAQQKQAAKDSMVACLQSGKSSYYCQTDTRFKFDQVNPSMASLESVGMGSDTWRPQSAPEFAEATTYVMQLKRNLEFASEDYLKTPEGIKEQHDLDHQIKLLREWTKLADEMQAFYETNQQ